MDTSCGTQRRVCSPALFWSCLFCTSRAIFFVSDNSSDRTARHPLAVPIDISSGVRRITSTIDSILSRRSLTASATATSRYFITLKPLPCVRSHVLMILYIHTVNTN
ncbi:hypothetical protein MAR_43 [Vibrio phage vB_VpaM_MAR]|uniref:Uncharacterized protein n=1 Tax=Vibrio phage vB_VpaM_MAR TaxID=1229754 RepID=K7R6R8_9CAUD|nr:hypothetical protein F861_gp42 [Vibrio phage vB_VpaM_MAR]AFV81381.1 hypothetical protein MAR_43 [Vibrio phage vB_VpaM_MAR]